MKNIQKMKTSAVYLKHEFNACKLSSFSPVNVYAQRLKELCDMVISVGSSPSDTGMVLQMLTCLPTEYNAAPINIQ